MRLPALLAIAIALSCCSARGTDRRETVPNEVKTSEEFRREKLMDEVEASVVMPQGALQLKKYARYYAQHRGMIVGAYTTHIEEKAERACYEINEKYQLSIASCAAPADVKVGKRRWVDLHDYPAVAEINCDGVQVEYDPIRKRLNFAECVEPTP